MSRKYVLRWCGILLSVYLLFVGWLYVAQESLMYHPNTNRPDLSKAPEGMVTIRVQTTDLLDLQGWYKPPREPGLPIVVMFHGNANNIEIRPQKNDQFWEQGWGVLLAEYRGFGGNPGKPSEGGFYKDAHAYMTWMLNQPSGRAGPVFVYGESMGSAVAMEMARHYDLAGVLLEVPFSSIYDIANHRYFFVPFIGLLLKDHFDNVEKLPDIDEPILIGAARQDLIVPYVFKQRLANAAGDQAQMITYNLGTHFNLHDLGWPDEMVRFVQDHL